MRMLSDSPAAVDDASSAPLLVTPASSTAATVGGALQPPAGGGDGSFDADMLVILAAMLCVLVCAIGLNSLVRCLRLHYSGHRTLTVAATHAAGTVAAVAPATGAGLKKRELRRIPVVVYEPKAGDLVTEECAICLGEFDDGEKVRVLPRCYHGFHVQCVDVWLATHSSCPTCRNSLLEEGAAGEATPTVEAGQGGT